MFLILLYFQIKKFEKLESDEDRIKAGKDIYDQFIMKELLSQSHVSFIICFFFFTLMSFKLELDL